MKNCLDLLTHQDFIDTAPLYANFERLTALMLVLLDSGRYGALVRNSGAICAAVKRICCAGRFNDLLRAKLDMLSNNRWRRCVLRQLGGEAALDSWERRRANIDAALAAKKAATPKEAPEETSIWRKTAELIAEDLWHIQHAQKCSKACAPKNVVRDPFKVCFDGLFRLPPLPRPGMTRRDSLEVLATTPDYREHYIYEAIPVTRLSGLTATICVYPSEFRAAEAIAYDAFFKHAEQRQLWQDAIFTIPQEGVPELALRYGWRGGEDTLFVIPDKERSDAEPGSNLEDNTLLLDPGSHCILLSKIQKVRDDTLGGVGEGQDAPAEIPD